MSKTRGAPRTFFIPTELRYSIRRRKQERPTGIDWCIFRPWLMFPQIPPWNDIGISIPASRASSPRSSSSFLPVCDHDGLRSGYARSSPRPYFSSRPASVPLRQPAASENTSLRVLLETYCPNLFLSFCPSRWLFNGHLQTLYAVIGDFSAVDTLAYDNNS